MRIFMILSTALMMLSFSSCVTTSKKAKKRIDRLTERFPDIVSFETERSVDTIVSFDTIFSESIYLDTFFQLDTDSIFIIEDNSRKVRTEIRVIEKDRIRLITEVKSDTIILTDTVFNSIIETVRVIDTKVKRWHESRFFAWFFFVCLLLITIYILYYFNNIVKFLKSWL